MLRLVVTADDRSGAMEAAALAADAGLTTSVVSWDGEPIPAGLDCVVVDLRSRHVSKVQAAARARASYGPPEAAACHKIDSTLRGNWAVELGALAGGTSERRVLLIPSYPSAGRTCRGGVVLVEGVPVADTEFGRDALTPVTSSEPGALLGAPSLPDGVAVGAWLASGRSWAAVADASTDAEIDAIVAMALAEPDVLLAGPASVVGATARALARTAPLPDVGLDERIPSGPVLVVCGSRHPASRAQAAAVEGRPGVMVLTSPALPEADPEAVALSLARRAHDHLAAHGSALVILLGGDTTDAFVGPRVVAVHCSVGVGMAYGSVDVNGSNISIISKPGGFGAPDAIAVVLDGRVG
jgi:uncharacterized protein YgbK (DUF1537 family)